MRFASSFSRSPGSSASSSHRVNSVTVAGTCRGLMPLFLRAWCASSAGSTARAARRSLENDSQTATCVECGFTVYAGPEPTVCALVLRRRRPDTAFATQVRARGGQVGSPGRLPRGGRRAARRATARVARGGRRRDRTPGVRRRVGRPLRRRRGRRGDAQPLLARTHRLRRADSLGRRLRVPLVRNRRLPPADDIAFRNVAQALRSRR